MNRTMSYAGWALMAAGIALLAYVGVNFALHRQATSHSWTATQARKGQSIAIALGKKKVHHSAKIPKVGAGSESATRLVIPKIGVDAPVINTPPVNGVWQVADWAVGHLSGSPNPGGVGNMALSAHDDIQGEIFKLVGELGPGDSVILYTAHAKYTYVVVGQQAVDPSDVAVLAPTDKATVTLISCSPYWVDTQRTVIKGVLKTESAV